MTYGRLLILNFWQHYPLRAGYNRIRVGHTFYRVLFSMPWFLIAWRDKA